MDGLSCDIVGGPPPTRMHSRHGVGGRIEKQNARAIGDSDTDRQISAVGDKAVPLGTFCWGFLDMEDGIPVDLAAKAGLAPIISSSFRIC